MTHWTQRKTQRWKNVQQVMGIKDSERNMLTDSTNLMEGWENFDEDLMNERKEQQVAVVEQRRAKISQDDLRKELKRMKSRKVVDPNNIPVEVWKTLREGTAEVFTGLLNKILESVKMPEQRSRCVPVPIFKNRGNDNKYNTFNLLATFQDSQGCLPINRSQRAAAVFTQWEIMRIT